MLVVVLNWSAYFHEVSVDWYVSFIIKYPIHPSSCRCQHVWTRSVTSQNQCQFPPSLIVLQDWTCSNSSMMSQTFFKHDWGLVCYIVQHTPCIYSCWIDQNTYTTLFNSPNDYCLVERWRIRRETNICWTLGIKKCLW